MFPNERFHNIFHLREDYTGERLIDDIELHFMELPKLDKISHQMNDRLVRWLTFIKGAPRQMWEELAMDTPGLKKAMTTLEFLSQSQEARALALAREKAVRDEISALRWAREEGKAEGKIQVAKSLLNKGSMSIAEISEVTGLPESEIEKLKEQLH